MCLLPLQHEREQVMTTNVWLTQVRLPTLLLIYCPNLTRKHFTILDVFF